MGLQQREHTGGKGAVFLKINAKEGVFQQGSKKDGSFVKHPAGEVDMSGTLIGFKIEDETFEGAFSGESLRLIFRDTNPAEPNMHVTVSITNKDRDAGSLGLKLLAKLNACDVSKPLTLTPWFMPKGTKIGDFVSESDMTGVTVAQEGNKIVEDFGNGVTKLPKLASETVKAGGKEITVKDFQEWNGLLDNLLSNLNSRFQVASPTDGVPANDQHASGDDLGVAEAAAAAQSAVAPETSRQGMRSR